MNTGTTHINVGTEDEPLWLGYGDRLRHVETGTPAIVEQVSIWDVGTAHDGKTRLDRLEVIVRFGGNPRTDPWGPFVAAPRYSDEQARDLGWITIERADLAEWELA